MSCSMAKRGAMATPWPWIAASLAEGIETVRINGLSKGTYLLRLTFLEPDDAKQGDRLFDVIHKGKKLLTKYDVAKAAGGAMRAKTESFGGLALENSLVLKLRPIRGKPILSGLELIRSDLPVDKPVMLEERQVFFGPMK